MIENKESIPFPILETERLRLRQIVPSDAPSLFRIFSSEKLTKYYGRFPMIEQAEAEAMIERFRLLFEEMRGIRWGIERKENSQFIGTVGFHAWAVPHHRAEIGYELDDAYQGKGFAHEALNAAILHAFQEMGLNRIGALVYPENAASEKVLLRLGFQLEGLMKQYAFFRNSYTDLNMFALLKE